MVGCDGGDDDDGLWCCSELAWNHSHNRYRHVNWPSMPWVMESPHTSTLMASFCCMDPSNLVSAAGDDGGDGGKTLLLGLLGLGSKSGTESGIVRAEDERKGIVVRMVAMMSRDEACIFERTEMTDTLRNCLEDGVCHIS